MMYVPYSKITKQPIYYTIFWEYKLNLYYTIPKVVQYETKTNFYVHFPLGYQFIFWQ